jgi:DNA-binding transcriptional regulator YdaS (Cro superfamily)
MPLAVRTPLPRGLEVESLYVAEFSGGLLKVGRSRNPQRRLTQHASVLEPTGVTLMRSSTFLCTGGAAAPERYLILKCAALAASQSRSEWFRGIGYEQACAWATEAAKLTANDIHEQTPLRRALNAYEGSAVKLAAAMGGGILRQHIEHWLRIGQVPAAKAPLIELATDRAVTCEELRPDVAWHVLRTPPNPARDSSTSSSHPRAACAGPPS